MRDNSLHLRRKENRSRGLIVIISMCAVLINLTTFGKGGKLNDFFFVREYINSIYKLSTPQLTSRDWAL